MMLNEQAQHPRVQPPTNQHPQVQPSTSQHPQVQPPPETLSDLSACKFFEDCREQLHNISVSRNLHSRNQKIEKSITQLQSVKSEEADKMLLNNLFIDYLRSHSYNYTYSVFMREANVVSEEVVGRLMLSDAVGVRHLLQNEDRINFTVIQAMLKGLQQISDQNSKKVDNAQQVEIIHRDETPNSGLILENRLKEVRLEVEAREKQYYSKQLEVLRSTQILGLRADITKELEEQYSKQKQQVAIEYQRLTEQLKKPQEISQLASQNQSLLNSVSSLKKELREVKTENQELLGFKLNHNCKHSSEYQELQNSCRAEHKLLEAKRKQLDLALRNLNTKVEEVVQQKKRILEEGNQQLHADKFLAQRKIHNANKDHIVETIHDQMERMSQRGTIIANENGELRETIRQLKQKVRQLESSDPKAARIDDAQGQPAKKRPSIKPKMSDKGVNVKQSDISAELDSSITEESYADSQANSEEHYLSDIAHAHKVTELQSNMRLVKAKLRIMLQ